MSLLSEFIAGTIIRYHSSLVEYEECTRTGISSRVMANINGGHVPKNNEIKYDRITGRFDGWHGLDTVFVMIFLERIRICSRRQKSHSLC